MWVQVAAATWPPASALPSSRTSSLPAFSATCSGPHFSTVPRATSSARSHSDSVAGMLAEILIPSEAGQTSAVPASRAPPASKALTSGVTGVLAFSPATLSRPTAPASSKRTSSFSAGSAAPVTAGTTDALVLPA